MTSGLRTSITPRAILICRIIGLAIFAAAFLLPACRDSGNINIFTDTYPVMSGLINPLILIYLTFSFFARFKRVRRTLAVAVLVCMAATWTFFWIAHLVPLVGHFMWIVGALMIVAGDLAGRLD